MQRVVSVGLLVLATVVGGVVLAVSGSGSVSAATTVTVGQVPATAEGAECGNGAHILIQESTGPSSPSYAMPSSGTLTSFSYRSRALRGYPAGHVALLVLRPSGDPTSFRLIGRSDLFDVEVDSLNTFPVSIPVQAGDVLGMRVVSDNYMLCTQYGQSGDSLQFSADKQDPALGDTLEGSPLSKTLLPISAELRPGPGATETVTATATQTVLGPTTTATTTTTATATATATTTATATMTATTTATATQTLTLPPSPAATVTAAAAPVKDTWAPQTILTKQPRARIHKRQAFFGFVSSDQVDPNSFECSLDGAAFTLCTSAVKVKVEPGRHTFAVRATDTAGNVDPTPATSTWIFRPRPAAE